VVSGDVLIATVTTRTQPAITAPSGWTRVITTSGTTTIRQTTYYHVAGGSEPSSYHFILSSSAASTLQVNAFRGVKNVGPVEKAAGRSGMSSATITTPSVASSAGDLIVTIFGTARASAITPQAGITERTEVISSTGTYTASSETSDKQDASTGVVGPYSATSASGAAINVAQVLILRWA
jgi:hypothetical protein